MQPSRAPVAFLVLAALALLLPAGCAKKDSVTNPGSGPTASFTATPLAGDRPLDVDFSNQSNAGTSAILSTSWDFGDGQTSASSNPGHLYSAAGTYTVSLTVTTAEGSNTQTRTDYILVGSGPGTTPPNALFSGSPTAGSAPLGVTFTDQSTPGSAPISAWSWAFGDGATSTAQSPSHTYAANGSYTVRLAVTTSVGTDTLRKSDYIVVTPTPVGPTAAFTGAPTSGAMPLTVQFTDQSAQGTQPITARSWNFGDGTPTSSATNPSHTYSVAGSYTVSLTVTTSVASDSESKPGYITVNPTPVPPTSDFTGTPTTGAAPLVVQFTDHSTPGTSPITEWAWTFGDGVTSTLANPSHTYTSAGSYSVSLRVTTADGQDTSARTDYITPCSAPVAGFSGTPTVGVAPLSVKFTDSSTGGGVTRSWNFGDGGSATDKDPTHVYTTPGTFTVSLTATNACGADSETKVAYITVADPCPDPVYTVTSASWSNVTDTDDDGYATRARLTWGTNLAALCTRSAFARIYSRPVGDTDWTLVTSTACYNVPGRTTNFSQFIQGLALDCYEFRVDVLECGGTEVKASRGPGDDADLTNRCFEP